MNIKFLRNCVLALCVMLLSSCTTIPHAMEAYHEHGWKGVVPRDSRADAYKAGLDREFSGFYLLPNKYAYIQYKIADALGDVRAKEKINSVSKKMSASEIKNADDEFRTWTKEKMNEMYKVPPEFDRNFMK